MTDASNYVRVVLTDESRQRRERRSPGSPGVGYAGGTAFIRGVAYISRSAWASRRTGQGSAQVTDADQAGLDAYLAEVEELNAPKFNAHPGCWPSRRGGCGGAVNGVSHPVGEGCRELFPAHFPSPRPPIPPDL